jgi:hypothetical protein
MMFEVLRYAPVETEPSETVLYDPCQPADLENSLLAVEDPELPTVSSELGGKLAALVASDDTRVQGWLQRLASSVIL